MQSWYMRPHLKALVELDLDDAGVQWPSHDGTRLALRGFKCMKKISVLTACVFVPDRQKQRH